MGGLCFGNVVSYCVKSDFLLSCKSYVRLVILYGSRAWCLEESEMGIMRRTERSMVIAVCGVQLMDRERLST